MIKGVHYTDTFAAAPDVTASRTLQALACGLKWERLCYDISTAYLQAKAELGDQIPLISTLLVQKGHKSGKSQ